VLAKLPVEPSEVPLDLFGHFSVPGGPGLFHAPHQAVPVIFLDQLAAVVAGSPIRTRMCKDRYKVRRGNDPRRVWSVAEVTDCIYRDFRLVHRYSRMVPQSRVAQPMNPALTRDEVEHVPADRTDFALRQIHRFFTSTDVGDSTTSLLTSPPANSRARFHASLFRKSGRLEYLIVTGAAAF